MPWNAEENAGFSTGQPWLPVAGDRSRQNVATMQSRSDSILHLYRRLIALRHQESELVGGSYTTVPASEDEVFAFRREGTGGSKLVALNLGDKPQTLDLSGSKEGRVLLSTCLDREGDRLQQRILCAAMKG